MAPNPSPQAVTTIFLVSEGDRDRLGVEPTATIEAGEVVFVVRVPANTRMHAPLRLLWTANGSVATRLTIRVERGADVTFIEELRTSGQRSEVSGQWSHAVEILVEDEAACRYMQLQQADAQTSLTIHQEGSIKSGASLSWLNASLGGGEIVQELRSSLLGADARSDIAWMAYAKGKETHQLSARNIFQDRNGRGEITMRAVAEQAAHITCDGMIEIGLKGGGTDTYLTQDVLMLDTTAKVDAVPGLEIKTNDVKASHSATISRLTAEDLFYFAARGIGEAEARRMFTEGFLADLVERAGDSVTAEKVAAVLAAKYDQ